MNRIKLEKDGKILGYVIKPGHKEFAGSKIASNKAFKEAIESGCYFREKLKSVMEAQNLWDQEKEDRLNSLTEQIRQNVLKLKRGGIKKSEAKNIALETRKLRVEHAALLSKTRELDSFTVEGQAENAGFDYLVSVCTVDEEAKPIFKSLDDYRDRGSEDVAFLAAKELSKILFDMNDDWEKELPENKFLIEHKFCDEKLRLINSEGKLISEDGKLIDEEGRYINADGQYVDFDGNLIDKDGNLLEAQPFLDD